MIKNIWAPIAEETQHYMKVVDTHGNPMDWKVMNRKIDNVEEYIQALEYKINTLVEQINSILYKADVLVVDGKVIKNRYGSSVIEAVVEVYSELDKAEETPDSKATTTFSGKALSFGEPTKNDTVYSTSAEAHNLQVDPAWGAPLSVEPDVRDALEECYRSVANHRFTYTETETEPEPYNRRDGNLPKFYDILLDGKKVDYCVWYRGPGWDENDPEQAKVLALETHWETGEFIPDPNSKWGYKTIELTGKRIDLVNGGWRMDSDGEVG